MIGLIWYSTWGDKPIHEKDKPFYDHKNRRLVVPGTVVAKTPTNIEIVGSNQAQEKDQNETK